jgi:hypothetical protein
VVGCSFAPRLITTDFNRCVRGYAWLACWGLVICMHAYVYILISLLNITIPHICIYLRYPTPHEHSPSTVSTSRPTRGAARSTTGSTTGCTTSRTTTVTSALTTICILHMYIYACRGWVGTQPGGPIDTDPAGPSQTQPNAETLLN